MKRKKSIKYRFQHRTPTDYTVDFTLMTQLIERKSFFLLIKLIITQLLTKNEYAFPSILRTVRDHITDDFIVTLPNIHAWCNITCQHEGFFIL